MSDNDARNEEARLARLEAKGTIRTVTVRLTATATLCVARLSDIHEISPDDILQAGNYNIEEIE